MIHKIFTPSWLAYSEVKWNYFFFTDNKSDQRRFSRNQLLSLLGSNEEQAGELVNYDYFMNIQEFTTSISHGQKAGAVISVQKTKCPGIGIDIEDESRVINDRAKKFFQNNFDTTTKEERLLYLWTKKEAAFKAIAPLDKTIKLLNHLWIRENLFGKVGSTSPLGEVGLTEFEGQIIATAYVFKTYPL
jgi:hypothetical protein